MSGPYPHSRAQSVQSLRRANQIRLRRAEAKGTISRLDYDESREECARWLQANEPFMENMPVFDLLLAVHRFGRGRVLAVLAAAGCSETVTVGGLTPRQRAGVCAALRLCLHSTKVPA